MRILRIDSILRKEGLQTFLERTKVKTNVGTKYPNLVLLKYDMINCDMSDPAVQQCRGVIVDRDDDYKIVSFPYTKFFNYGDSLAHDINWETARVYEKLDGSIMTIYYYDGAWQVQSNGTVDAGGSVGFSDQTFAQLFWETWEMLGYKLPEFEDACYMFEMMTPLNRIVVRHTERRIVCHGARYLDPRDCYEEYHPHEVVHRLRADWEIVKTHPITDLSAALAAVEKTPGIESEGFVVCDHNFNRLKIKSRDYVRLHHLVSAMSYRRLLEIVQKGDVEEFLGYFPEYTKEMLEVQTAFLDMHKSAVELYYDNDHHKSQKDFALAVKHHPLSAALFALRAKKVEAIDMWMYENDSKRMLKLLGLKDKTDD